MAYYIKIFLKEPAMKKTVLIFTLSLILTTALMFSCGGGGGGGGVDNAIEDNSFSIGYNANGAESGTAPSAQNGNGKEVLSISANTGSLAKAGYLFDGWNTSADGSGADYAPGALYNGKNIILYAKWAAIFNYSINSVSPAPSLDGAQMAPAISYATITGLTEKGMSLSDIAIPQMIDGYTITSIGSNAFQGCTNVSNVQIPETVTNIGDSAFSGCSNLTDITMKGTVPPSVGTDAFAGCVQLAVTVPQSAASAYNSSPSWSTVVILAPGTFSIIYNGNGSDSGIVPQRQVGMTGVTILVYGNNGSLTRAGCTFDGWNTKADGTGNRFVEDGSYAGPDNMTLYAQWTHPDYTVVFDGDEANTQASPSRITVKAPANTIASLPSVPPKKDGFYFGGWYTQRGGAGSPFIVGSQVINSMTVYAKWTLRPDFTVTYNAPEATTPAGQTSKVVVAPKTTVEELPTAPARTGYNFGGWYTEPNGKGTQFTAETPVNDNITVYAKWNSYEYVVTFDYNNSDRPTGQVKKTVSSPDTSVGTLPTAPVRGGYYFVGWNTAADGSGNMFISSTPVTANITVYPKWSLNPTFTVTFDSQGANTAADPSIKEVVAPATKIDSLPTDPVKEDSIFAGWFTGENGTGDEFTADTVVSEDITVYAKWLYNYTVRFDSQNPTTPADPTSKTVLSPATTVVSLPTSPTKTGYTFGGWYTGTNGSGTQFTENTTVTSSRTVYAKWTPNTYQIIYKDKGGSAFSGVHANPHPQTYTYDVRTDLYSPTKTGYNFGGWYADSACEGSRLNNLERYSYTADITLYAKWVEYSYTVTFNGNGADVQADPQTKTVASPATTVGELPTDPSRTGYDFVRWDLSSNGSGGTFYANSTVRSNRTVYAQWTPQTYQITYKDKGGSAFSGVHGNNYPTSHTYDSTTVLVSPKKTGWLFGGWYADSACSGSVLTQIAPSAYTNDITLYAKWDRYEYTVTFDGNGATTSADPTSIVVESPNTTVGSLPAVNPLRPGYVFAGWNTQQNGQGETFTKDMVIVSNKTVYATWKALFSYSISNGKITIKSLTSAGKELSSINIPSVIDGKAVVAIGKDVFKDCTDIIEIIMPDSIENIGDYAFSGCTGITSIIIPNNVTSIGAFAFSGCTGITNLIIPDSVTSIDNSAFRECTGLTQITIPNSVTSIGSSIFSGCKKLSRMIVPGNITSITSMFYNCTGLQSVTIENGVTDIGVNAFYFCRSLNSITIPNSVTSIGESAFYNCICLTSITIPDSVTSIGRGAFSLCSGLTEIIIPNSVNTILSTAFTYCTNLTSIKMKGAPPTLYSSDIFNNCNNLSAIKVPAESVAAYKAADGWSSYANLIVADE